MKVFFRFIGALAFAGSASSFACAAPSNDDWSGRTVITELPFAQSLPDVGAATSDGTDPEIFCWSSSAGAANRGENSVWYGFTTGAADEYVDLDAAGYDTILAVYEGAPNTFVGVRAGCNDDGAGRESGSVLRGLRLRAHTAYSILVASRVREAADAALAFSMSRSIVYRVTKTEDSADGRCDTDCSLREAVLQSNERPGAVLVPAGRYPVRGGLDFGIRNAGGENVYGAGMDETVVDGLGEGRVATYPFQAGSLRVLTHGLHDLTLTNGATTENGGAVYGDEAYFVFDRVALRDSSAQSGGAAYIQYGATSFYESLVSGNRARGNGGGLSLLKHRFEALGSTFARNESQAPSSRLGGGGVYADGFRFLRLINTTISGNRAMADAGGLLLRNSAVVEMNNVSIVGNTFGESDPQSRAGGLLIEDSVDVRIHNSVLSGNHAFDDAADSSDCESVSESSPPLALSTSYVFVQAPGSCAFPSSGDQIGLDAQLLPLGLYDSRLPVHVPAPGSPLIDAGDPGDGCAGSDARGVERPQDGDGDGVARCDIGAIEWTPSANVIFADGFEG